MSTDPDFGYSNVVWEDMNPDNLRLVEAEYRQRFEGTLNDAQDLDKKAQFVLTGLVTAILGLAFSQAKDMQFQYLTGLYALAVTFGLGAIFANLSLYPRTYAHLGATPTDLNVTAWLPLLKGGDKDALRLSGVRIKEYAVAIDQHTCENAKKSRWLKRAMTATALSFPIALVSVAAAAAVLVLLHSTKATVVAPVLAP